MSEEREAYFIDTPVSFMQGDRRVVGVIKTYRSLPTGRLYTVKADHDSSLISGLRASRLTPL